ncbi:MAG: uroporphyrinogen-III C-methyltransferase [Blastocatellia bacterium]|nr:uroporphyrinogen-III C-methyltransferase [Blastocatellia bacterium]
MKPVEASARAGRVFLVGAGPGDPGLLTVKAHDLLTAADCVIYDYLVNPEILRIARPKAELLYVGKQGGRRSISQEEINRLLIAKAEEHELVVRLKGGDPFVFGRGGEEALALAEAGISWEVVPGVSSGIAAAAYAGIPVTHRGLSSSVAFLTAHEDPAKAGGGASLGVGADTLVFFMGVSRIAQVAQELCEQGRDPATPVAVIRWGTYEEQEVHVGELRTIAAILAAHDLQPPALIIVGEVVRLREQLNWFASELPAAALQAA